MDTRSPHGLTPTSRAGTRHVERSAVTALLPVLVLVPFWMLALLVVWAPLTVVGVPYWQVPVAWVLGGTVLWIPAVQIPVLSATLRARRPTSHESAVLEPLWDELVHRAGLKRHRYALRVIDSDELNAFACGGHLVVVTTFAIEHLTPAQLSGVIAHEISHHLGWHTASLTIGHWLSVPIVVLARFGFFVQNVASAATDAFAGGSALLTATGRAVSMSLTGISWLFLAALHASDALSNLVGHRSEFEADRRAVRLGYGPDLAAALRVVIDLGGGGRPNGVKDRLAASHPPARTRVARIDAMSRNPNR